MGLSKTIWTEPAEMLRQTQPDHPVMFFSPSVLQGMAQRFLRGFPGMVTYAVKSNPDEAVILNLAATGITGFDVASPAEIALVARLAPGAALHYNNPVRARSEIAFAVAHGVRSFAVDSASELAKLIEMVPPEGCEISVRYKLPVSGAAYNFGAKFGATVEKAAALLSRAAAAGFTPSLTFHPGTQCTDPMAWDAYIRAGAEIMRLSGVKPRRLNVGGGFPSHRLAGVVPALETIFALIDRTATEAFGPDRPALICEPGRGLVAEAFTLATRVKAIRDGEHVFLNDGVYGGLAELPMIGLIDRITVLSGEGVLRSGAPVAHIVFGPTCDSVDRLPGEIGLPADMAEDDYVLFHGMGAYSLATNTHFNGFGEMTVSTAMTLR